MGGASGATRLLAIKFTSRKSKKSTKIHIKTYNNITKCDIVFREYNIGAINWGLVKGKTNTVFQWDSLYTTDDPDLWFHDIFRKDGTPFDQKEIDLIKSLINLGG